MSNRSTAGWFKQPHGLDCRGIACGYEPFFFGEINHRKTLNWMPVIRSIKCRSETGRSSQIFFSLVSVLILKNQEFFFLSTRRTVFPIRILKSKPAGSVWMRILIREEKSARLKVFHGFDTQCSTPGTSSMVN